MSANLTAALQKIELKVYAPAAWITLSNPPANVIDLPMMDELIATLEDLEQRADVTCIVFSGGGKGFSAGVDVAAHHDVDGPPGHHRRRERVAADDLGPDLPAPRRGLCY